MYRDRNSDAASTVDQSEVNSNQLPESDCRKTVAQCIAMITPVALMMAYGMSIGYSTVLIPGLYKNNTEVVVTLDELTWISSMNYFLIPLGAVIAGPLLDRLGRRALMLLGSAIYTAAWIMFFGWSSSAWALLTGFALTGLAGGIADPSCQIYTSEITDLRLRGAMSVALTVAITFGIFLQIFIDMYLSLKVLALFNAAFPLIALVLTFLAPESPHWLASKGRSKDAERALRWLRGWKDSSGVRAEYKEVIEYAFSAEETASSWSCQLIRQRYIRRVVLLPFALLNLSFFLSSFNGIVSILSYSVLVFEKLESPVNEYTATLILTVLQLAGPVLLMITVHWMGKRKPTIASLLITGLCFTAVAVYSFLRETSVIQQNASHSWIPTTLVLLSVFVSAGGIRCTPWFIAGELFPVEVRGVAVGVLAAVCSITAALASKTFLYKLEAFALSGTFLFFALVNLIGFAALYWTMPETEGKTFVEIEAYFAPKAPAVAEKFAYYNRGLDSS